MNVGFTGPYSDVNFGDYAMLVNNIYTLGSREATIFVYDRPFLEKIGSRYLSDYEPRIVDVRGPEDLVAEGRANPLLSPVDILESVRNLDEITEAVSRLDVLYVNGGGYFNSLWTQPHRLGRLLKIIAPILIAATQNKEIVFTANGFGPFRGDLEFFAGIFGSLPDARFGVRDRIMSRHWLAQAGVRPEQVFELPDDLLFIEDRLKPARSPKNAGGPYIVMETYLATEVIADNIDHFEVFSRKLKERYSLDIVFLPFNVGNGGVRQGQMLQERLPDLKLFDISHLGFLAIEDAVAIIQNAELVVSNRYHAVILALSLGVPFASVLKDVLGDKQYYYGKNAGALEGVLRGERYNLLDYFFTDYVKALERLSEDLPGIVDRQRRTFNSAFTRTRPNLRAAREAFMKEGSGNG